MASQADTTTPKPALSLADAIKPARVGCPPIGAKLKGGKGGKAKKGDDSDDSAAVEYKAPAPKTAAERREWDRMSSRMEGFHSYFRQSFKQIWELADTFRDRGVSLREYLSTAEQLVHHLEGHHGIEEQYIFPVLAKRMPEFQDAHVEEHKAIHAGMDRYEKYLKAVRSGEADYNATKFREIMASWSNVLFYHLDAEVHTLREENLRRYYTLEEVRRLPM